MKMCQKHWDALRDAIRSRGLWHLVAQSGEAAIDRVVSELNGTADLSTYDPLLDCHNMILGRAVEMGGLYMMSGDYCPICEAVKYTAGSTNPETLKPATEQDIENYWINGPADAVLTYCRENQLTAGAQ